MIYIIIFIFGLIFGSFANVVIWRFPRDISIVLPGSFCVECGDRIPWYLNIPVLSYIFLRGKCSNCKEPISIRYPTVELITATVTLSWFIKFGLTFTAVLFFAAGLLIIIAAGIDWDYKILPPRFTYGLIALGLVGSPFNSFLKDGVIKLVFGVFINTRPLAGFLSGLPGPMLESLAGALTGAVLIFIVRFLGTKIFKKEAMGLGDLKLMAGIGALIGPVGVFWALFIGSILGSIAGVGLRISGRVGKLHRIPFGPYLSLGMVIFVNFSGWLNGFLI